MVSHLFHYQLALLAILWLFVLLHVTWSEPNLTTPAVPAQPKRTRATEPHPFAGLTHKPPCALCGQETGETAPAPPRRPDPDATQAQAAIERLEGATRGGRALRLEESRPREERRPLEDGPRRSRW